jgi:signal transduction histidine kinase
VQAVGLRLSIADDGRGIGATPSDHGFGMTSMQQRAERIGASLTIVTAPRNGTEVVLAWDPAALPTQVHVAS